MNERETTIAISKVEGGIEEVAAQIKKVEKQLEDKSLPKDEIDYLRKKKELLRKKEEQLREKEILILQQQQQPTIDNKLLRGIKRYLEHFQTMERPTPMDTPASLGHKTIYELEDSGLISEIDGNSCYHLGQPAVLQTDKLKALSRLTNDHQVVAFMTPVFEELLGNGSDIQVVNSEEYPWLQKTPGSTRYNQKPDTIFCHSAVYESRPPFETDDEALDRLRSTNNKYGILVAWGLRDCIDVIGDAKVKIDNRSFGEVVNYARHICYQNDGPKYLKFLLYDMQQFWLIRAVQGQIASVVKCGWDSAGGKQILKSFVEDGRSPWIKLLLAACNHWNLDVKSNSFLGKGTFGRVFRVELQEEGGRNRHMALKIVLPGDDGSGGLDLEREQDDLRKAADIGGVAQVHDFNNFGDLGAAMLLADIGSEVPQQSRRQLFGVLGHLHEREIVHGDPRWPNAIFVQGSVRWIDFRTPLVALSTPSLAQKRRDLKILVKSCHYKQVFDLTAAEEAIKLYNGTELDALRIHDNFLVSQNS